jgi:hypothetical protein
VTVPDKMAVTCAWSAGATTIIDAATATKARAQWPIRRAILPIIVILSVACIVLPP